jgi:hypothetical protein
MVEDLQRNYTLAIDTVRSYLLAEFHLAAHRARVDDQRDYFFSAIGYDEDSVIRPRQIHMADWM